MNDFRAILKAELDRLKETQGLYVDEYNEEPKCIKFRIGYKLRYTEIYLRFSQFDEDFKNFKESIVLNYPLKKIKL